jgi:hypothetical protein
MQVGNDETDRLQLILGDTVDIQPKDDQILAPAKRRLRESMTALDVVSPNEYWSPRQAVARLRRNSGLQATACLSESLGVEFADI